MKRKIHDNNQNIVSDNRTELARIIISNLLDSNPNHQLNRNDFMSLRTQIVEIYPTENPTIYYVPSEPQTPKSERKPQSGKLYSAYVTKRRALAKNKIIETRRRRSLSVEIPPDTTERDNQDEEDYQSNEHLIWLRKTFHP